jgi:hypothetical protein
MENNYTAILKLDNQTQKDIEKVCKESKYLGKENLIEQLEFDGAVLNSMKVTLNDIMTTHKNMLMLIKKTNDYRQFTTQDTDNDKIKHLQNSMSKKMRKNRTFEETVYNQIDMNGSTFQILQETTTDYNICNITKCCSAGDIETIFDQDYFIWNVNRKIGIWVSDLGMYQIDRFGFFHGVSSDRRIDPIKYIEVMEMDMMGKAQLPIVPVDASLQYRWRCVGDISGEIHDVSQCVSNENYDCYVYQGNTKICIQFKNDKWLHDNCDNLVKILGINMMLNEHHSTGNWYDYKIIEEKFLTEGDMTEMNNMIALADLKIYEKQGSLIFNDILNLATIN